MAIYPDGMTREERSFEIDGTFVGFLGDRLNFHVESQYGFTDGTYSTGFRDNGIFGLDGFFCGCKDFKFRAPVTCKHQLRAIRLFFVDPPCCDDDPDPPDDDDDPPDDCCCCCCCGCS